MAEPSGEEREASFERAFTCCAYTVKCLVMAEYLEGLDKCPQQDADGLSLSQQLDETSCSEQSQEAQVDKVVLQHIGKTHSV